MKSIIGNTLVSLPLALGLCLGILLALEAGRRLGIRRLARDPEGARAGLGTVEGSMFALLGFAFITAVAIYVIMDLEFPRLGFIRVDAADRALLQLRQGMN